MIDKFSIFLDKSISSISEQPFEATLRFLYGFDQPLDASCLIK